MRPYWYYPNLGLVLQREKAPSLCRDFWTMQTPVWWKP